VLDSVDYFAPSIHHAGSSDATTALDRANQVCMQSSSAKIPRLCPPHAQTSMRLRPDIRLDHMEQGRAVQASNRGWISGGEYSSLLVRDGRDDVAPVVVDLSLTCTQWQILGVYLAVLGHVVFVAFGDRERVGCRHVDCTTFFQQFNPPSPRVHEFHAWARDDCPLKCNTYGMRRMLG
jgi:hypothetical protein